MIIPTPSTLSPTVQIFNKHTTEAFHAVLRLVTVESPEVRAAAQRLLAHYGDTIGVPPLDERVELENNVLREEQ
jgi:HEAT repeat protein